MWLLHKQTYERQSDVCHSPLSKYKIIANTYKTQRQGVYTSQRFQKVGKLLQQYPSALTFIHWPWPHSQVWWFPWIPPEHTERRWQASPWTWVADCYSEGSSGCPETSAGEADTTGSCEAPEIGIIIICIVECYSEGSSDCPETSAGEADTTGSCEAPEIGIIII